MQNLNVTFIQSDLIWAAPEKNLAHFTHIIGTLQEPADLIVLPEMFSTAFNMTPETCYETMGGPTVHWMKSTAKSKNAVICGSLLIKEEDNFYNRFLWVRPDGTVAQYDKRHLFRMAGENNVFTGGTAKTVVELNGFRFLLQICYDLRFPVWSKNRCREGVYEYDAIIYVANWPASRSAHWKALLTARAIENQAYVIGVNRIGKDANGTAHTGDSVVLSPKGEILSLIPPDTSQAASTVLNMLNLSAYRKAFPAGADWDNFEIL